MSVSLSLKNICRRFIKDNEEFLAVNNVNLDVQPGEFLTFLGPSGCGKTTTLRMIAGFETRARARSSSTASTLRTFLPTNAGWALCSRTTRFSRT